MPADSPLVAHAIELLSPLGEVRARRMFGGHGLYLQGLFIAIIADEVLYLKADGQAQPAFAAAGCLPFSYSPRPDRQIVMSFWNAPEEAMDSPAGMAPWARLAMASALRAAAAKAPAAAARPRARPAKTAAGQAPTAAMKRRSRAG